MMVSGKGAWLDGASRQLCSCNRRSAILSVGAAQPYTFSDKLVFTVQTQHSTMLIGWWHKVSTHITTGYPLAAPIRVRKLVLPLLYQLNDFDLSISASAVFEYKSVCRCANLYITVTESQFSSPLITDAELNPGGFVPYKQMLDTEN